MSTGSKKSESRTYTFAPIGRSTSSGTGTLVANSGEPGANSIADFTINFSGRGVAPVSESTGNGGAGNVRIGASAMITKTLKNIGDGNLSNAGTSSNLNGSVTGTTVVFAGAGGAVSLADGVSRSFDFTFSPTARGAQSANASVQLTNGSTNGANAAHTITWALSGTGVGPQFGSNAPPTGPINFGALLPGTAATRSLQISNATPDGNLGSLTDLTILSASFGGPDSANFSLPVFSPVVIPGGGTHTVDLQFTGLEGVLGAKTSVLTLTTDQGAVKGQTGQQFTFDLLGAVLDRADFDENRRVDGEDFALWRQGFGTPLGASHRQGDADANGSVDGRDFLVWQRHTGTTSPAATVPEPETGALLLGALAVTLFSRRRP